MKLLSSDARNSTAFAISSGVPRLPSGTVLAIVLARCWPASEEPRSSFSPGVSVAPGLTALTRMWRSFKSDVQVRANERTAAFVGLYTLFDANPFLPPMGAFRVIAAPSRRHGSAPLPGNKAPLSLMSEIQAVESSPHGPKGGIPPT